MQIRAVESKDIPQLTQLVIQLLDLHFGFDRDYYQLEGKIDHLIENWLTDQLAISSQLLLIAEDPSSKKITGFISGYLKPLFPWFQVKTVGHISFLVIEQQQQKKGIGKLLEEAAIAWFKARKVPYVELYVDEKNLPGQKAWKSYEYSPFKKILRKKI